MLYMLSDAYYYVSLADSLNQTGKLWALTSEPQTAIVTSQNGIVFFHYALIKLGITNIELRVWVISLTGCGFLLGSFWLLAKLMHKRLNVSWQHIGWIMLIMALNTQWYVSLLQPVNDVYFLFLSFAFIYFYFVQSDANGSDETKRWIALLVIALLINHFRLQGVFLFLAAMLVALRFGQFKLMFAYAGLLTVSLLSVTIVNQAIIDDFSGISASTQYLIDYWLGNNFAQAIESFFLVALPRLFIGFSVYGQFYFWLFVILVLLLLYQTWVSWRLREHKHLFLAIMIWINVIFVMMLPFQVPRYLFAVVPFIFVLLLNHSWLSRYWAFWLKGYVATLLVIAVVRMTSFGSELDSGVGIHFSIDYSANKAFMQNVKAYTGDDYDLVAHTFRGRVSYMLFDGKPSINYDAYDLIAKNRVLYVGDDNGFANFKNKLPQHKQIISAQKLEMPVNLRHSLAPDSTMWVVKLVDSE